ncbi:hypothetical protein [Paraburkholderia sp. SIMBA_054]|uniref:type IV pilus modification PilV family protein n=1 Tax=Paraburkholderia sp. SIMBA_054 TaxID=3085795 RepID=UPI003978F40F
MAVAAVTVLGLIAVQLSIARDARATSYREQATLVADAIAEAARVPNPKRRGDGPMESACRESVAEG